jgi:hypothetical protein
LRDRFDFFGEDVLAHAVGAGEHSSKGPELDRLLRENRDQILEWLQEKRDEAAHRAERSERVQGWTLVFAFLGVIVGILALVVTLVR